jgi:hypothetical protein
MVNSSFFAKDSEVCKFGQLKFIPHEKLTSLFVLLLSISTVIKAQEPEKVIKAFFDEALTDKTAYNNLETFFAKIIKVE